MLLSQASVLHAPGDSVNQNHLLCLKKSTLYLENFVEFLPLTGPSCTGLCTEVPAGLVPVPTWVMAGPVSSYVLWRARLFPVHFQDTWAGLHLIKEVLQDHPWWWVPCPTTGPQAFSTEVAWLIACLPCRCKCLGSRDLIWFNRVFSEARRKPVCHSIGTPQCLSNEWMHVCLCFR